MLRALLDGKEMSARPRVGRGLLAAGTRQIPPETGALRLREESALPRAARQSSRTGSVSARPEELTPEKPDQKDTSWHMFKAFLKRARITRLF